MVFADVNQQFLENGNVFLVLAVVVVQSCDDLRDELNESLRWYLDVILLEDIDEGGALTAHRDHVQDLEAIFEEVLVLSGAVGHRTEEALECVFKVHLPLLTEQLIFLPERVVVFLLFGYSHLLLCLLPLAFDLVVVQLEDFDVGESHDVRQLVVFIQSSFL